MGKNECDNFLRTNTHVQNIKDTKLVLFHVLSNDSIIIEIHRFQSNLDLDHTRDLNKAICK